MIEIIGRKYNHCDVYCSVYAHYNVTAEYNIFHSTAFQDGSRHIHCYISGSNIQEV